MSIPFVRSSLYRHRRLRAPGRSVFRERKASWLGGPGWLCLEAIVTWVYYNELNVVRTLILWLNLPDVLYASLEFRLRLLKLSKRVCEVI
jgi:hypothetical protein